MPDYQYSKIYKIFSKSADLVYYGSTTQTVAMRVAEHRGKYKKWLKGSKKYTTSFLILEHDNWEYELVCKCPCNSKLELHRIEGGYIKKNKCVNKLIAGRTVKEWRSDNKEKNKEKRKIYYEKNKEKDKERVKIYQEKNKEQIKEQRKIYREKNKEKNKEQRKIYREKNKEKLKEKRKRFDEKNKEKLKEQRKIYREKNKKKLFEKRQEKKEENDVRGKKYYEKNKKKILEKVKCECGSSVSKGNLTRHVKTKKHKTILENIKYVKIKIKKKN